MTAFDLGLGMLTDLGVLASVTVERVGASTGVDAYGDAVKPAVSSLSRDIVTHWTTPAELQRLKLDHTTAARTFYSDEDLLGARAAGSPDVIQYDSERWEVFRVEDYLAEAGLTMVFARRIE